MKITLFGTNDPAKVVRDQNPTPTAINVVRLYLSL